MSSNYKNITKLSDLLEMPVGENGEEMVLLDSSIFRIFYQKPDMQKILGDKMYLRKTLVHMLERSQREMQIKNPAWQFLIVYAYRSSEIQTHYFTERIKEIKTKHPELSETEQRELAHSMSADPTVAGHPTGGAVDITIFDRVSGKEVDMGSKIAEFGDIAYTFYPGLSKEQKNNRLFLNQILTNEGFAPFLGEWWHFSYGDKEWAFYYKKSQAIYDVVKLQTVVGTQFI